MSGYLGYRGGQSVWRFITSKWGDESIAQIFEKIKENKNVNKGIKAAIGLNIKTLNDQWKNYLKETYWDEIGSRENINEFARQLTDHEDWKNSYNIAPAISPNGGKIAILSNKNGPMSIYIISADNGKIIKCMGKENLLGMTGKNIKEFVGFRGCVRSKEPKMLRRLVQF